MTNILERIELKKRILSQAPFLMFLREQSLDPLQRFSFVPCMAPFVMGLMDLGRYLSNDGIPGQPLPGAPASEEDSWGRFLTDLRTLGLNTPMNFTNALLLLWGDDHKQTRQVIYGLTALIADSSPVMRRVIVQAVNTFGAVTFRAFRQAARDFQDATGRELGYFNSDGPLLDTAPLSAGELSPELEKEALALVDKVFTLLLEMTHELLDYSRRVSKEASTWVPSAPAEGVEMYA